MARIAQIAVEKAAYHYDRLYSYLADGLDGLQAGMRVMVPFGRGGTRMGLVVLLSEGAGENLKAIRRLVDETPVLDEEGLALLRWLKEETFCTWFEALSVLIPAGYGIRTACGWKAADAGSEQRQACSAEEGRLLDYLHRRRTPADEQSVSDAMGIENPRPLLEALEQAGLAERVELFTRRVQDASQKMVRLAADYERHVPTPRQAAVIDLLEQVGCGSVREICYFAGVTKSVVDRLEAAGAVEYYEEEIYRIPYACQQQRPEPPSVLSQEQKEAEERLAQDLFSGEPHTALLYGVTGSGKTQVFLSLTDRALAAGRGVILLVPEISLTPQVIEKFHRRYGGRVAVLHSGLSLSQRLDEYKRVQRGLVDIVVGTRSAVFAPLHNLGLIVIDEEQEHTYRSESSPRFDARAAAAVRAAWHKGLLLLASATPSVESFYRAQKGDYTLVTLKNRYGAARLPDVTILDMATQEIPVEGLSLELCQEIYNNLQAGEQTILLMNRRGHSTQAACMACRTPITCPNCSVSMKYHAANGRMMCHYCGYSMPLPEQCPSCGSPFIRYSGLGTQKVEAQLRERFPEARILRMDQDTTMRRFSHQRYLADFAAGKYDIMVGTQMVAKGLDFPNVTLVGVLGVDQMLYSDDFRSFERTFSLITQVVGRCGRDVLPGRAFLQTFTPENPILQLAAAQKYEDFYRDEIISRREHLYPPFCRIACIGISAGEETAALKTAQALTGWLAQTLKTEYPTLPIRLLGPSPGALRRVAGRYRYKILVKTTRSAAVRELLSRLLEQAGRIASGGARVFIQPDYESNF